MFYTIESNYCLSSKLDQEFWDIHRLKAPMRFNFRLSWLFGLAHWYAMYNTLMRIIENSSYVGSHQRVSLEREDTWAFLINVLQMNDWRVAMHVYQRESLRDVAFVISVITPTFSLWRDIYTYICDMLISASWATRDTSRRRDSTDMYRISLSIANINYIRRDVTFASLLLFYRPDLIASQWP